jgi:AraC-like DNA-binding protein
MRYREFTPPAAVGDVVTRFWLMSTEDADAGTSHRVLPDGCVDLIVLRRGNGVVSVTVRGPRLTPLFVPIEGGEHFWGARLLPDAGPLVVGVPAAQLMEQMLPGASCFGADAARLGDALSAARDEHAVPVTWQDWLAPRIAALPPMDSRVRLAIVAINAMDGSIEVPRLAAMVSLSVRQLQRRFREATGLTVKSYARIRRLRRSLVHLVDDREHTWSEVASRLGFADQSHLINEFGRLAGARPSDIAAYVHAIEHLDVVP